MVQALVNSLNNVNNAMVDKSLQFNGVDKCIDFESNVFDKLFDKEICCLEQNIRIADLNKNLGLENSSIVNFKKILQKAQHEANVESSLDLTLDKDITDVLNKFKDFIESSKEEGKALDDDSFYEKLKATFSDDDLKIIFAHYLAIMNLGIDQANSFADSLASIKEDIASLFSEITEETNIVNLDLEAVVENVAEVLEDTSKLDSDIVLDSEMFEDLNIESIEAETSSMGGETLMQNQSAEEQGIKVLISQDVESFDVNLIKTLNNQPTQTATVKMADVSPSRILEQISRQLESMQTNSKVNIVLNPESLGKVNVQLMSTKAGLTAQFTVNTAEARDLLMKGLDGLKESLLSYGVSVDNVSVKLNEAQESHYNADWTEQEGSKGGNKGDGQPSKEEKEKGLFERTMANLNFLENGNV